MKKCSVIFGGISGAHFNITNVSVNFNVTKLLLLIFSYYHNGGEHLVILSVGLNVNIIFLERESTKNSPPLILNIYTIHELLLLILDNGF